MGEQIPGVEERRMGMLKSLNRREGQRELYQDGLLFPRPREGKDGPQKPMRHLGVRRGGRGGCGGGG